VLPVQLKETKSRLLLHHALRRPVPSSEPDSQL
jgi:hypothetical protein